MADAPTLETLAARLEAVEQSLGNFAAFGERLDALESAFADVKDEPIAKGMADDLASLRADYEKWWKTVFDDYSTKDYVRSKVREAEKEYVPLIEASTEKLEKLYERVFGGGANG